MITITIYRYVFLFVLIYLPVDWLSGLQWLIFGSQALEGQPVLMGSCHKPELNTSGLQLIQP